MSWKFSCPCGKSFDRLIGLGLHSRRCAACTEDVRLWASIDKDWPGGCWQWMGARQRDGYAHFNRGGKTLSIHRYLYERLVGQIPNGLDLLHACDNPACVYPGHMSPGTHQQNMLDKQVRGRAGGYLTPDQVREIRKALAESGGRWGINVELARRFKVRPETISDIRHGSTYRHVQNES